MIRKYINNWYSLLALYFRVTNKATVKFRDGNQITINRRNSGLFYEEIYRRYLKDNGFDYEYGRDGEVIVKTPHGLRLNLYLQKPYSFVLDEIFLMNIYGRADLKGRIVIDIGAGIGDSALYFVKQGASKVYAFEPEIDRYHLAEKNIRLNNSEDKIVLFNIEATAESLRDTIFENELKNIFVKIDCEGCEYEIISNTDYATFENMTDVVMEYHDKPLPLVRKLSEVGFKTTTNKREIMIYASKSL